MRSLARAPRKDESGFTLVEVLVAMTVMLTGVLGVATLVNTADSATGDSLAREGSTNLAREILERSRQVPYNSLGGSSASSLIRAKFTDETTTAGAGSSWTITRRGITYTTSTTACRIDDPSDGSGPIDSSFCSYVPGNGGSGSATIGGVVRVSLELAGLPLNIGVDGSVVNAICNMLGGNSAVQALVTSTAAKILNGADVEVCSGGASSIAVDSNPDDVTRVKTTVTYSRSGKSHTLTQSTIVPNPGQSS
jgi:prepilin-type N-terminal cleavage/methylation domain-containing protein